MGRCELVEIECKPSTLIIVYLLIIPQPIYFVALQLTECFSSLGSIAMSFLEIGGLFGSISSGYITDKLVQKVQRVTFYFSDHSSF